MQKKIHNCR